MSLTLKLFSWSQRDSSKGWNTRCVYRSPGFVPWFLVIPENCQELLLSAESGLAPRIPSINATSKKNWDISELKQFSVHQDYTFLQEKKKTIRKIKIKSRHFCLNKYKLWSLHFMRGYFYDSILFLLKIQCYSFLVLSIRSQKHCVFFLIFITSNWIIFLSISH